MEHIWRVRKRVRLARSADASRRGTAARRATPAPGSRSSADHRRRGRASRQAGTACGTRSRHRARPARRLAGEQFLLKRLPVRGVVDVVGDVALRGAERPAPLLGGVRTRWRVAQPRGHAAPGGVIPVRGDLRVGERHRAASRSGRGGPTGRPPRRRGVTALAPFSPCRRLDRRPALRPHPAEAAAERADREALGEPGKAPDRDPVAAHDPHCALREARVLNVGVRDVLEPAGEGVEPDPPGRGAVREPGAHRERVLPCAVDWRDELVRRSPAHRRLG